MGDNEPTEPAGRKGKVRRKIEKYGLDGIGDRLEREWTAETERQSLRSLADEFNVAVLRAALADCDIDRLPGDAENIYTILTDEGVTSGNRVQTENLLQSHGVDVDEIRADFVSRQAVHTFLRKHRDAEYDTQTGDKRSRRRDELRRLGNRHTAVVERTLTSLDGTGEISLGQFQVLVSTQVQCADCGAQFEVSELLERGGCDCPG